MDIGYTWIDKGKICRQFSLLIWTLFIGKFVQLLGDGVNEWLRGIVILPSCEYYLIRLHENLVQHNPRNNILKKYVVILM